MESPLQLNALQSSSISVNLYETQFKDCSTTLAALEKVTENYILDSSSSESFSSDEEAESDISGYNGSI